jgi:hypothetical protein
MGNSTSKKNKAVQKESNEFIEAKNAVLNNSPEFVNQLINNYIAKEKSKILVQLYPVLLENKFIDLAEKIFDQNSAHTNTNFPNIHDHCDILVKVPNDTDKILCFKTKIFENYLDGHKEYLNLKQMRKDLSENNFCLTFEQVCISNHKIFMNFFRLITNSDIHGYSNEDYGIVASCYLMSIPEDLSDEDKNIIKNLLLELHPKRLNTISSIIVEKFNDVEFLSKIIDKIDSKSNLDILKNLCGYGFQKLAIKLIKNGGCNYEGYLFYACKHNSIEVAEHILGNYKLHSTGECTLNYDTCRYSFYTKNESHTTDNAITYAIKNGMETVYTELIKFYKDLHSSFSSDEQRGSSIAGNFLTKACEANKPEYVKDLVSKFTYHKLFLKELFNNSSYEIKEVLRYRVNV